jgi:hypothetical protein
MNRGTVMRVAQRDALRGKCLLVDDDTVGCGKLFS